jgi:hypothetical protein
MVGVEDLMQRTRDGRTGRVAPCVVCTVHVKARSAGFFDSASKPLGRFVSGLVSKPLGRFVSDLASKSLGRFFSGLISKSVATVFSGLALKSVVTVSHGLASKPVLCFLV